MQIHAADPRSEYEELRKIAYALAGGLNDLPQRAAVYHHLYADSEGRNVFPLIAAHGALWAKGYFQKGLYAGKLLSLLYAFRRKHRTERNEALLAFANAFSDINRRVCAEAYCAYHFSRTHGQTAFAQQVIPKRLLAALNHCHAAKRSCEALSPAERRELFEAFFLWEQETIVAAAVEKAVASFNWPAVKWLAMKPKVDFAYFKRGRGLQFEDFSQTQERIEKGLMAYERAEEAGYAAVERALKHYRIMPARFFCNTDSYCLQAYESACSMA